MGPKFGGFLEGLWVAPPPNGPAPRCWSGRLPRVTRSHGTHSESSHHNRVLAAAKSQTSRNG
jgi:hypothetical protein